MKSLRLFPVVVLSIILAAGMLFVPQVSAAPLSTIVVNTIEDELNTDGDCSLREAITAANMNGYVDACQAGVSGSTDTITFDVGGGTIVLTEQLPNIIAGNPLVIDGGEYTTISGDNTTRVLLVHDSAQLTLKDITVMAGASLNGGAIYNAGTLAIVSSLLKHNNATDYGGSIMNKGTLTVTDSFIALSSANWGGGIYNHENGTAHIINSTITHNDASLGAGIYNHLNGALDITGSNFTINNAAEYGGGITNWQGSVTITDSTFAGNHANYGGAIDNAEGGVLSLVNSFLGGEDTDQNSAVFWGGGIHNGGSLSITNGTFFRNTATHGGGIYNTSTGMLGITDSFFNLNNATEDGGGIYNDQGEVGIMDTTFNLNDAIHGGGIYNEAGGTLEIVNLYLGHNSAGWGGGMDNRGASTITHSTFAYNSADIGGGIYNHENSTVFIGNSTFSANSADSYGGGVSNWKGTTNIANSTFSGNSALWGGALDNSGTLELVNSILADSPTGGNCKGTLTDQGHNIEDINTCALGPGSWVFTDPLLAPLLDNGGPTLTHALLAGSPAIDNADPIECPGTDQRWFSRPRDGNGDGVAACDIGAFEFQPKTFLPAVHR